MALNNTNITYVVQIKDRFNELKDINTHDPHSYLTSGKKSRKLFLIETIEIIKTILQA